MKLPGPDHPITVAPETRRVRVTFADVVIADTVSAVELRESTYPAVYYVPRQDVDMSRLHLTKHTSHCPYKGDASYYTIESNGRVADNAVWSYVSPYPAMQAIAGMLAFYPDRVDAIAISHK